MSDGIVDPRDLPTIRQILCAPYGEEAQAVWREEVIECNRQTRLKREAIAKNWSAKS